MPCFAHVLQTRTAGISKSSHVPSMAGCSTKVYMAGTDLLCMHPALTGKHLPVTVIIYKNAKAERSRGASLLCSAAAQMHMHWQQGWLLKEGFSRRAYQGGLVKEGMPERAYHWGLVKEGLSRRAYWRDSCRIQSYPGTCRYLHIHKIKLTNWSVGHEQNPRLYIHNTCSNFWQMISQARLVNQYQFPMQDMLHGL